MWISRYLEEAVHQDLAQEMVFLSGPRQVGKTTLAKTFLNKEADRYYNWDNRDDRRADSGGPLAGGNGYPGF